MRDYGLRLDTTLPPADLAVKYLLDRVQYDANLRWHMLGTTAFGLLLEAEAARTGEKLSAVEARRSVDLRGPGDRDPPECYRNRERVRELEGDR